MLQIRYFLEGNFYNSEPNTNKVYITLIEYIPVSETAITDLLSIKDIDLIIDKVKNKKTKLVIYAGDEGYYFKNCSILNVSDSTPTKYDLWSRYHKFDKNYFHFLNHNLKSRELTQLKGFNFTAWPNVYESEKYLIKEDVSEIDVVDYRYTKIKKHFLSYNRSWRAHREYLIIRLLENDLLTKSIYSFNKIEENNKSYSSSMLFSKLDIDNDLIERYKKLPSSLIGADIIENENSFGQKIIPNDYLNTFVSIVTETEVNKSTIYFSEKTFKPILTLHPFILVSAKDSLKKLKKLGYKTFDKWWDESYDECDNFVDRIDKIINILVDLSKKSTEELDSIKLEMFDVLKHNRDIYYSRIKRDFLKETLISIEKY